jgi:hypothetical protein
MWLLAVLARPLVVAPPGPLGPLAPAAKALVVEEVKEKEDPS